MSEIVIVAGALANKPFNGGAAWTRLSWILGLRRLGFEVCFLEEISAGQCRDSQGSPTRLEDSVNLSFFEQVTGDFGLSGSSALICEKGRQIRGMGLSDILDASCQARFLLNISGHLRWDELLSRVGVKVYLDLDPGFTQFWQTQGQGGAGLEGHDLHFTVGENIGTAGCPIPDCGLQWLPIRQPVLLDLWPMVTTPAFDRFTTIATWRGPYGPIRFEGRTFGLKVHEFRKFLELPLRTGRRFEIALDIHADEEADLDGMRRNGWKLTDPSIAVSDPDKFRRYVQDSGAEFSVAQGVYVDTCSGWFSDRTVRYLASGRPALVQDTGFSRNVPCGDGLLTFRTLDEAVEGVEQIADRYSRHSRAARQLAEEYFDSDRVLGSMLNRIPEFHAETQRRRGGGREEEPKSMVQGARSKAQGARSKVQGPKSKVQGPKS